MTESQGPTLPAPNGILLANPIAMKPQGDISPNSDPLLAMEDDVDEGMDTDENVDIFLNLENIEDVEMSTNSTKSKRIEEVEESMSHA